MSDCRRLLAGRLNIQGALTQVINGGDSMSNLAETQEASDSNSDKAPKTIPTSSTFNPGSFQRRENPSNQESADIGSISAATCETCAGGGASSQLVFALGQVGFDFGIEARRDSIVQHMDPPANPHDPNQLLAYLEKNPWDASAILWTLNLDATPIYAIRAQGAFASEIYQRLREFLGEETHGEVERVSIPGFNGGSARLFSGQVVPVIWPDLRGMYSWNTAALVEAACGKSPTEKAMQEEKDTYIRKAQAVADFLQRVYEELRNLGAAPQERAINYAATNAFQAAAVFKDAIETGMDLDTIEVVRSPICRPESDCWDVRLTFFNPSKVFEQARKVYLFTVDVSDVVPVMVGTVRSWFTR
jgi:cyanobactin maturation PatA/PatG family protease